MINCFRCPLCKKLEPEFEEAATFLSQKDDTIVLATIDCTDQQDKCRRYYDMLDLHIRHGYPILLSFKNGDYVKEYVITRMYDFKPSAYGIQRFMLSQSTNNWRNRIFKVSNSTHVYSNWYRFNEFTECSQAS